MQSLKWLVFEKSSRALYLNDAYYRPEVSNCAVEYRKAVPALTIFEDVDAVTQKHIVQKQAEEIRLLKEQLRAEHERLEKQRAEDQQIILNKLNDMVHAEFVRNRDNWAKEHGVTEEEAQKVKYSPTLLLQQQQKEINSLKEALAKKKQKKEE